MSLQRITRDIKIKDETGKEMEALKVFQFCIQFLKEHLFKSISDKIKGIKEHDLHYVLTVPAIWEDSAKQFMREAALQVCISCPREPVKYKENRFGEYVKETPPPE